MIHHILQRFSRWWSPAATFPSEKECNPSGQSEQVLFDHSHRIPYSPKMKCFDLQLNSQSLTLRAIFGQFFTIVNGIKLHRLAAGLIVETFIMCIETD